LGNQEAAVRKPAQAPTAHLPPLQRRCLGSGPPSQSQVRQQRRRSGFWENTPPLGVNTAHVVGGGPRGGLTEGCSLLLAVGAVPAAVGLRGAAARCHLASPFLTPAATAPRGSAGAD